MTSPAGLDRTKG